jgi:hypothetical protein
MAEAGYLNQETSGYSLTRKGRRVARLFDLVKRMWKLGSGG